MRRDEIEKIGCDPIMRKRSSICCGLPHWHAEAIHGVEYCPETKGLYIMPWSALHPLNILIVGSDEDCLMQECIRQFGIYVPGIEVKFAAIVEGPAE